MGTCTFDYRSGMEIEAIEETIRFLTGSYLELRFPRKNMIIRIK
jgi:hypothetical protein